MHGMDIIPYHKRRMTKNTLHSLLNGVDIDIELPRKDLELVVMGTQLGTMRSPKMLEIVSDAWMTHCCMKRLLRRTSSKRVSIFIWLDPTELY